MVRLRKMTKVPSSSITLITDFWCSIHPLFCITTTTPAPPEEYDVALRPAPDSYDVYLINTYHLKYLPSNESEHDHFSQGSSYFENVSTCL